MASNTKQRILANPSYGRTYANAVATMMESGAMTPSGAFLDRVEDDLAPAQLDALRDRLDRRENLVHLRIRRPVCLRGYADHHE